MNKKKIKEVLKRDLWWNVEECKENGLIDDIWTGTNIKYQINKDFSSNKFDTENIIKKKK